jgi:hypothetical protein
MAMNEDELPNNANCGYGSDRYTSWRDEKALKPHQMERQLQRLRRKIEGVESGDGRPKDAGDMLEALKREHPEMWEQLSKK